MFLRSPLHLVAPHSLLACSLLLDAGASPDAIDATQSTPLHAASSSPHAASTAALLMVSGASGTSGKQNAAGWTAAHVSAFAGCAQTLRQLLAQRAVDLSATDAEGFTALHCAAGAGQLECVRLLVSRGAECNARAQQSGDTPLHLAARMGHAQVAIALLKAGADPGRRNAQGICCDAMPGFQKIREQAEAEITQHSKSDVDLPLQMDIPASVPEARPHHFVVDEKAVEAVANSYVSFVIRTAPARLGLRFVVRCSGAFDAVASFGWTLDHRNGCYTITYRQPMDEQANVCIALLEGGEVVAKRNFVVNTVAPRTVGRYCVAFGPGLFNPTPGKNTFVIRSRNQCGTNVERGGDSFDTVVTDLNSRATTRGVLQDHGNGSYTVQFDLPEAGSFDINVSYQGQSISGFPINLNMDRQARIAPLIGFRRVEEDVVVYKKKLDGVDNAVNTSSPAARRHAHRVCVGCSQREVSALLLPCRHYRYCAACASGHVVLGTPCQLCKTVAQGYIQTN